MKFICTCFCLVLAVGVGNSAPANGFVFPDERRQYKKLEPVITPPVLPVLEHLERDPSTLLPGERGKSVNKVNPRFGFGGGFNVKPTGNGGLSASVSSSASGAGVSHSASQSFSFGFNEGFSASHSASQASSFNGFGSGLSGSQASSQAAAFSGSGSSVSGAASSSSALGGFGGQSGSQSASSAFGFNSINAFQPDEFLRSGVEVNALREIPPLITQYLQNLVESWEWSVFTSVPSADPAMCGYSVQLILLFFINDVKGQSNLSDGKVVLVAPVLASNKHPRARVVETAKDFPVLRLISNNAASRNEFKNTDTSQPIYVEKLQDQINIRRRFSSY